jgi:hypothetical protein
MRKIEVKIFALIIAFFVLLSNINSSYARYVSSSNGSTTLDFSTWKILVNNTDITYNYTSTMNFTPTIITRSTVRSGKFAPGSIGYFDIVINTSNVQTAYNYTVAIAKTGDIANLKVIGYSNTLSDTLSTTPAHSFCTNSSGGCNLYNDNATIGPSTRNLPSSGNFSNFTIRIFFKWIDNYNGTSTNVNDTLIGKKAANGETITYNIAVSLTFSQAM